MDLRVIPNMIPFPFPHGHGPNVTTPNVTTPEGRHRAPDIGVETLVSYVCFRLVFGGISARASSNCQTSVTQTEPFTKDKDGVGARLRLTLAVTMRNAARSYCRSARARTWRIALARLNSLHAHFAGSWWGRVSLLKSRNGWGVRSDRCQVTCQLLSVLRRPRLGGGSGRGPRQVPPAHVGRPLLGWAATSKD